VAAWVLLRQKHKSWPCPVQFPWIHLLVTSWRCVCHCTAHQAYAHVSFLTARTRSRLSSHTISTWLVSYTSDSSCGRASSVRCAFQDVEVTCLALPSRTGVALLWFDCRFTSFHYAFARWPRGIVSARCNLGHRNFRSSETRFASTG